MIIGLITTVAYTVLAVIGITTFYEAVFQINIGNIQWTVYGSILITIVISLVLHSRAFLQHWQQAKVESEKFEKESISAKYESLKNQVNPHFLFNNLNALTNLVYEDQDKAVKFIKQLSDVYRYVLDTRDREVVPLEEEVKFLNAYIFLQQIRFGDKLKVDVMLNGVESMVAPLSLQMLIENAIKHNVVSDDNPLHVNVYSNSKYIVVENNLQKKVVDGNVSSKLGLENIRKRYEYISGKKVVIEERDAKFVVCLPFINELK
jgi:LytS/YehU family sensor histidine kinase